MDTAMEIDHPGAKPLGPEQLVLLEQFRARLQERVASVGLTPDDVQRLVKEIRQHPDISVELMRELRAESEKLLPGQRLVSFDWD
jgi:hypothetical protein